MLERLTAFFDSPRRKGRWFAALIAAALLAGSQPETSSAAEPPVSQPAAADAAAAEAEAAKVFEQFSHHLQAAQKFADEGKHRESGIEFRGALDLLRKVLPADDPSIETIIDRSAGAFTSAGAWPEAIAAREDALAWRTKVRGAEHWQTVDARLLLEYVRKLSKLTDAERAELTTADQAAAAAVDLYGRGEFTEAIAKSQQAGSIRGRILGLDSRAHAEDLNNLGLLYSTMGNHAQAEALYRQAGELQIKLLGAKHPDRATNLSNRAVLRVKQADYAGAEPLYVEAREILRQTVGEQDASYATCISNLAVLYAKIGDESRAEPLLIQARDIKRETVGVDHPDYATSISVLAQLYYQMDRLDRAEPLYREAAEIRRRLLGEQHPSYAGCLEDLSFLLARAHKYDDAEKLMTQALAIRRRVYGTDHLDYALGLNNLASMYVEQGENDRAEPLLVEAVDIRRRALGDDHAELSSTLGNLALVYAALGQIEKAEPLYRRALAISRKSLASTAAIQSERQQLAMGRSLRHQLDSYVSFAMRSGKYAESAFAEVAAWKGATLVRQRAMRLAADDPAVADVFAKLQQTAGQLAALSRDVSGEAAARQARSQRIAELTAEVERLEAELSAKSAAVRQATREVTLDDLQAALPADAVLVDFLEFVYSESPRKPGDIATAERRMAAFVVRPAEGASRRVTMISLGSARVIGAAVDRWRSSFGVGPVAEAAGAELRKLAWEPVLAACELPLTPSPSPARGEGSQSPVSPPTTHPSPSTFLVSTDGVLGRMPIAALPGREPGTYLIEDHRLAMVPVPQLIPALLADAERPGADRELLLLGDVDYDAVPGAADVAAPKRKQPRRAGSTTRAPAEAMTFDPLANTAGEIAAIRDLYGKLFETTSDDPRSLVRAEAGEVRFRELAPRYRHLHLATHGFFAGAEYTSQGADSSKSKNRALAEEALTFDVVHNPGLLSGLALAGANREPSADGVDGVLTSQEIGVMNLSGVDTVVLSACDTGLGETAGGEGLLGVQRAFQVAGARTTVASFWKVDDLVTRLLMERFYGNLWEREMSRLDALREAQLYVLNHPEALRGSDPQPEDPKLRTAPRLWAALTLSGDWR